ncbi:hypothetical protein Tco_0409072 [Tanacetum coccineum]
MFHFKLSKGDWLEDTDEEIDEQELEAHYSYMAKIQEVSPAESSSTDTPLEQTNRTELEKYTALMDLSASCPIATRCAGSDKEYVK